MEVLICQATKRNWDRLRISNVDTRLTTRANKTNSSKRVLPLSYFSDTRNAPSIEQLVDKALACDCRIWDAMYSFVLQCFHAHEIATEPGQMRANVQVFLSEYSHCTPVDELLSVDLPQNEDDLLGLIYQSLYVEGDRNKQGLYYTPAVVARQLNEELDFEEGQLFLDPCCGSGSFLLNAPVAHPLQLYGIDCDPIAVMLCKANLIIRFKEYDFEPQVYCFDFLAEPSLLDLPEIAKIKSKKFDCISTNPPWGALARNAFSKQGGGEAFACFLDKALDSLADNGVLNFLLPESFLNVKAHGQLRLRLLQRYSIEKIRLFPSLFTGVTTKAVALTVAKRKADLLIPFVSGDGTYMVEALSFQQTVNCIFLRTASKDKEILDTLYEKGQFDLSQSTWALGIVTGNNAEKLLNVPSENSEPIYTGKEIRAYQLLPPKKHIVYDRSHFQQVAKDEIYRAKEKLVYKFISNNLVFAYDNSGSLFLNSANILIPAVPTISIQSMLIFLNSELFRFAYAKQFGEIKVLKGNLCALPFPALTLQEDEELKALAEKVLEGDKSAIETAQKTIYGLYKLSDSQIQHIREGQYHGSLT